MISINLSDSDAMHIAMIIDTEVADSKCHDMVMQIIRQLSPASTSASELSKWKHDSGHNDKRIEAWKRKHEVMDL